jgi:hypothetical protein
MRETQELLEFLAERRGQYTVSPILCFGVGKMGRSLTPATLTTTRVSVLADLRGAWAASGGLARRVCRGAVASVLAVACAVTASVQLTIGLPAIVSSARRPVSQLTRAIDMTTAQMSTSVFTQYSKS